MELPNIASEPQGPVRDIIKFMIVYFIGTKRITCDRELHENLNNFMNLTIPEMNGMLRELEKEKKINTFPVKVPVGPPGNYGHMAYYSLPGTLPV